MVFETSCWVTANNDRQMMIDNNSVQRHPKIDYFDPNSVKAATPIISHISSNGYYGYCAMPYNPTNDTNDFAMHDAIVDVPVNDSMMHAQPTKSVYQGQTSIDKRKRTNQYNDSNNQYSAFEIKRSRIGFSDCIEDMQTCGTGDRMDVVDTFDKVDTNKTTADVVDNNNSTVNKASPNNYFKSTMMTSHLI